MDGSEFGVLWNNIIKIILIFLVVIIVGYYSLYWAVWNNAKLSLGKAMDEIEDRIDKRGYIEEQYIDDTLATYCSMGAIDNYEVTEVSPGFEEVPNYLGQPLFVEVRLYYSVMGREHTMTDRVTTYNRGTYGEGYNTINQH